MRSILLPALFAGVSLVTASPISPRNQDAPTCVVDDLLSLLRANAGSAKPFCRAYLNYVSTSIVATVTPPAVTIVATETRTSTHLETVTVTDTDTIFTTVAETVIVETQTITTTSVPSVPSTTSEPTIGPSAAKLRRQLAASDYPAASISSACSCLNVRMCGKKGTTTLAAATETVASTVVIDATETSTATDVATTTVQTTETALATATTVVTATPTAQPKFRLVATNQIGITWYLKAGPGDTGDVLAMADNADDATDTFQLDSQGRLSFVSADYDGQRVYSFMSTTWWVNGNTDLENVLFNTLEDIAGSQDLVAYQWVADPDTGNLSVTNGPAQMHLLSCYGAVQGMGTDILTISTAIPHLGGIYDPSCSVLATLLFETASS